MNDLYRRRSTQLLSLIALCFAQSWALSTLCAAPDLNQSEAEPEGTKQRTMLVSVVGPDGRPMPGANLHVSVWTQEKPFKANRDPVTDSKGQALVKLPKTLDILRLWAGVDGHVPLFVHWERDWQTAGRSLPKEFTFQMIQGTVVGGYVKNEDGEPIPGARVEVCLNGGSEPQNVAIPSMWLAEGEETPISNGEGRWSLDNVPGGDQYELRLKVTHPDYVSDFKWGLLQGIYNISTAMLREQTATILMPRGIQVTGTVTDPKGKPVAKAVVVWGDDPYMQQASDEVRTDEQGVYRLPPLPPAKLNMTVVAKGWAPDMRNVDISTDMGPVNFPLEPGKTLRLRFVDERGDPLPYVGIGIAGWRGVKSLYNHKHPNVLDTKIPTRADKNGVYEWTWAPSDFVQYNIWKKGYDAIEDASYRAGDDEIEIMLTR